MYWDVKKVRPLEDYRIYMWRSPMVAKVCLT